MLEYRYCKEGIPNIYFLTARNVTHFETADMRTGQSGPVSFCRHLPSLSMASWCLAITKYLGIYNSFKKSILYQCVEPANAVNYYHFGFTNGFLRHCLCCHKYGICGWVLKQSDEVTQSLYYFN